MTVRSYATLVSADQARTDYGQIVKTFITTADDGQIVHEIITSRAFFNNCYTFHFLVCSFFHFSNFFIFHNSRIYGQIVHNFMTDCNFNEKIGNMKK